MRIAFVLSGLWSKLKKIMFWAVKCPFYVNEFASVQCSFDVSSSATYSRIRGNKSFRLDKKKQQTNKKKKKEESKQWNLFNNSCTSLFETVFWKIETLGEIWEFCLVWANKIQPNKVWCRLRVAGSQDHIPTQTFWSTSPPPGGPRVIECDFVRKSLALWV